MKNITSHFKIHSTLTNLMLVSAFSVFFLTACSKKEPETNQAVPASKNSESENITPRYKQTERFGSVSNIILTPLPSAPSKYSNYIRQEVSEVTKDEYKNLSNSIFENYVTTWIKQAASVEKPNFEMIASINHPEITGETNEFKKQEIIDKVKSEFTIDKNILNIVYGWQGDMLSISGPDVATGEYYLYIKPHNRYQIVSYQNQKNHTYNLYYQPVFEAVGMTGDNTGGMQLTVKVPIEKAKEIESLRDGTSTMIRVYGHIVGVDRTPQIQKSISQAELSVEVEALEFGVRKNGEFKTFFFLDSDQLKRSKS